MERLKRSVGIELAAGPFAPTEVSGADQNGSGNRGRNESHAAPLRVCSGECVTANTVYARINHGPCEVREPALLIRVTILPLLDLQQLLRPIDACVTQQIVYIPGPSRGFVGISNFIRKYEKAGDDVGQNEGRTDDRPTTIHTGERRHRGSSEDDNKGVHGQQVPRTDIHSGHHRHSKIKDGRSKRIKQLAVSRYLACDGGERGENNEQKQPQRRLDQNHEGEVVPQAVRINLTQE